MDRSGARRTLADVLRERGNGDVVEIANSAAVGRASTKDAAASAQRRTAVSPDGDALAPLTAVAAGQWRALAERAIEPNGYYLPDWELAVNASARGRTGVSALSAWSDASSAADGAARLIGLMPVDLDVARLQDPPARAGQRRSLRHAVHAAARSRHGRDAAARIDAARRGKPAPMR